MRNWFTELLTICLAFVLAITFVMLILWLSWGVSSFWWAGLRQEVQSQVKPWPVLPTPPAFVIQVSVILPTCTPTPPVQVVLPTRTPTPDVVLTEQAYHLLYGDFTIVTPDWGMQIIKEN